MAKRKRLNSGSANENGSTNKETSGDEDAGSIAHDRLTPVTRFLIEAAGKTIRCDRRGADDRSAFIFTHGVGGGIESPVMTNFAEGFAQKAPIVCFQGNMNLKSRIAAFSTVLEHETKQPLAIGGRSMGARAAVLTALDKLPPKSMLVLVSYPLTAGKNGATREPDRREQILLDLPEDTSVLFVSGSRDAQCDLDQLSTLRQEMKATSWLMEVRDANHGMEIRPKNATSDMRKLVGSLAAEWLLHHGSSKRYRRIQYDVDTCQMEYTGWSDDPDQAEFEHQSQRQRS